MINIKVEGVKDTDKWLLSGTPEWRAEVINYVLEKAYNQGVSDGAKNIASNFFVSGQVCFHRSRFHLAGTTYVKCAECGQIVY